MRVHPIPSSLVTTLSTTECYHSVAICVTITDKAGGRRMSLGACIRCVLAGIIAAVLGNAGSADAMQFHAVPFGDPGTLLILAEGEIIPGDVARLRTLIASLPVTATMAGYALDSPGGDLLEAEQLATAIYRMRTNVVILSGARCVSACFLLFAAGAGRFVAPDALIGVHSASNAGRETAASMAVTTAMARDAAILGVPPSIIGEMVTATPGQVDWLTRDDLAAMKVVVMRPNPPDQSVYAAPAPPADAIPRQPTVNGDAVAAAPVTPEEPPDFRKGLTDRRNWEQWYSGLTGAFQQGAFFWSAHRGDPKLPSCYPGGQNVVNWTAGCLAAQQRLAASDVRRKTDPTYRQGWNSY